MSATYKLVREATDDEVERIGFYSETEAAYYVATGKLADGRDVDMIGEVVAKVAGRTGLSVERVRAMIHVQDMRPLFYRATVLWSLRRRDQELSR